MYQRHVGRLDLLGHPAYGVCDQAWEVTASRSTKGRKHQRQVITYGLRHAKYLGFERTWRGEWACPVAFAPTTGMPASLMTRMCRAGIADGAWLAWQDLASFTNS